MDLSVYASSILAMTGLVAIASFILGRALDCYNKRTEKEYEASLVVARAQAASHEVASFEQLRSDINYIISLYVAHDVTMVLNSMGENADQDDVLVDQLVADVSTKTLSSLSQETIRQFSQYATVPKNTEDNTEDFLTYFVRKEALTKVLTVVRARTSRSKEV